MRRYTPEKLSFGEAFFGLILEPRATIEALFQEESAEHGLSMLVTFLAALFLPMLLWGPRYGAASETIPATYSFALLVLLTILVFFMFQGWLFMVLGIECSAWNRFTIIGYCCAPLVIAVVVVYSFNYFSSGYISLLRVLITGQWGHATRFVKVLPIALILAQLAALAVYFYSIRAACGLHTVSALAVTVVSLIPFYLSFSLGLLGAQFVHPGILEVVLRAFNLTESLRAILGG